MYLFSNGFSVIFKPTVAHWDEIISEGSFLFPAHAFPKMFMVQNFVTPHKISAFSLDKQKRFFLKKKCGMLVIKTLKFKISDFLHSNTVLLLVTLWYIKEFTFRNDFNPFLLQIGIWACCIVVTTTLQKKMGLTGWAQRVVN